MVAPPKPMTVEAFDEWMNLPENADKRLEFVGGEIVELPNNAVSSEIAGQILFFIKLYLYQNKLDGHVTGEGGGYQVAGERYAPDVAYVSIQRQSELDEKGYNSIPPDLAVEVISPSDKEKNLRIKVSHYLMAGTTVWVVDPKSRTVEVYAPGQTVKILDDNGTLDGGTFLPELKIPVQAIFRLKQPSI